MSRNDTGVRFQDDDNEERTHRMPEPKTRKKRAATPGPGIRKQRAATPGPGVGQQRAPTSDPEFPENIDFSSEDWLEEHYGLEQCRDQPGELEETPIYIPTRLENPVQKVSGKELT